jgi:hypothetical protein
MLALDVRVSDDIELDLVGPVAGEFGLSFSTGAFITDPPMSSPSTDPGWLALSSALWKLLISGVAGDPLSGRGCGRMSGD